MKSDPAPSFPPVQGPPREPASSRSGASVALLREGEDPLPNFNWRTNLWLFVATVASVFFVGQSWTAREGLSGLGQLVSAWTFAVPLLAILVCHEFGHYIAARLHRVPASLPYFLPLPILNPFGTLGAVIVMPRRIRSANALLDIGAAGPLAGMVVAVPIMLWGLSLSELGPRSTSGYIQEGQSILYFALKATVFGHIPADQDVHLHPTALAAWVGFFVTFLNLLPFGQLDGGHVAYALFGRKQNQLARWFLFTPVVLMLYNAWLFVVPLLRRGFAAGFDSIASAEWLPVSSVTVWVTIFILLLVMRRSAGSDHPPVDDPVLSPGRKLIAAFTLGLFVLLFMPSPWVVF